MTQGSVCAQGIAEPCAAVGLEVVGEFDPFWTAEIDRVCEALPNLPDRDRTARVRILGTRPVTVVATLSDGRATERSVLEPAALRHTIEALITVPPTFLIPVEPAKTVQSASPQEPPAPAPLALDTARAPDISVELGALLVARTQGSPLYVGAGPVIWASFNYSDWVFGLAARLDPYVAQPTSDLDNFEMIDFGAGLEFARRFQVDPIVGIDVGLGAQVLEELQSANGPDTKPGGVDEVAGESTDVRLVPFSRLHVGGRGVRFTADLEFEVSPVRLGRGVRLDEALPTLPSFGLGLGAGISWQEP